MLDAGMILVVIFAVIFIGGGLLASHLATKASSKQSEESKDTNK